MDEAQWWIIDILLPAVLLIWLVVRTRRRPVDGGGATNPRDNPAYIEEEARRREGTDGL